MLDNNSEGQVCLGFFSELLFGSLKIWHCFKNIAVLSGVGMTVLFLGGVLTIKTIFQI